MTNFRGKLTEKNRRYIPGYGRFSAGGVSRAKGPLPPNQYNPSGLTANCGFCSISRALFVEKGITVDADRLYVETLTRLGLPTDEPTDPIPRTLIFPEPIPDRIPLPVSHQALAERGNTASSYTITSVADASGLRFRLANCAILQSLIEYCSRIGPDLTIDRFAEFRLEHLKQSSARRPSIQQVRAHLAAELGGHSIIGSKTTNHFINLNIDPKGKIEAFDAQSGKTHDGKRLKAELTSIDLFMRMV